jgi:hypothetical protein
MTPKEINILVTKAVMTKEVYPSMSFPILPPVAAY